MALHTAAAHSLPPTGSLCCHLTSDYDQPEPVQRLEPNRANAGVRQAFSLPAWLICPEDTPVGTSPGLRMRCFLKQFILTLTRSICFPPISPTVVLPTLETEILIPTWIKLLLSLPLTLFCQTTSLAICPLHYHKLNSSFNQARESGACPFWRAQWSGCPSLYLPSL